MKIFRILSLLLFLNIVGCSDDNETTPAAVTPEPVPTPTYFKGMDLSFQSELENYNLNYEDENGQAIAVLDLVQQKGTNLIRLKLWHTPTNGENTLAKVKAYALRIKAHNMKFMLDIHYSDTWADPSHQTPPAAWQSLTNEQLQTAVYDYTKQVMTELKDQGTTPAFVQIGNETDSGFLWNFGKVWDDFANNWPNYAALVGKAASAIREVGGSDTKIILHHGSVENAIYFFNELLPYAVDFDVIGLSYYPQYHTKDLNLVQTNLNTLAGTFNNQIMIVETAYPFTLGYSDNQTNLLGTASQIIPAYPATPDGQKNFLLKIDGIVKNIPNGKGIGWIYWAPDWIAFTGNEATSTGGTPWENQTLWDFDHKALPAFDAFN